MLNSSVDQEIFLYWAQINWRFVNCSNIHRLEIFRYESQGHWILARLHINHTIWTRKAKRNKTPAKNSKKKSFDESITDLFTVCWALSKGTGLESDKMLLWKFWWDWKKLASIWDQSSWNSADQNSTAQQRIFERCWRCVGDNAVVCLYGLF